MLAYHLYEGYLLICSITLASQFVKKDRTRRKFQTLTLLTIHSLFPLHDKVVGITNAKNHVEEAIYLQKFKVCFHHQPAKCNHCLKPHDPKKGTSISMKDFYPLLTSRMIYFGCSVPSTLVLFNYMIDVIVFSTAQQSRLD